MSTTTTIETLPMGWDNGDSAGEWPQGSEAAGRAWHDAFDEYLTENYPHCFLSGNRIYGPATYRFDGLDMQSDTPAASELKPLPEDGIYTEFADLHSGDWCDVIERWIADDE